MTATPDPFPHLIWDGAFTPPALFAPAAAWGGWEVGYVGPDERGKRTSRAVGRFPPDVRAVFAWLRSADTVAALAGALGLPELEDDPAMHAGGLHCMERPSWLQVHLDGHRHPHRPGVSRAVSAVAFLNPEWDEAWGGALLLCDGMGRAARKVYPAAGRLVAFRSGRTAYHGVEEVVGPAPRVTAAVFLWAPAGPDDDRPRAMFLPSRSTGGPPPEVAFGVRPVKGA